MSEPRSSGVCLVVGGDGLIGSDLARRLKSGDRRVMATTRRTRNITPDRPFVDLASGQGSDFDGRHVDVAVFCAGITSMAACEADPEQTCRVNVDNTMQLARKLLSSGTRIVYLSSNAVFDGKAAEPDEHAIRCPSTEYGRQKAAVEEGLLALPGSTDAIAIVRLAKVLSPVSGQAAEFKKRLASGERCPAFDDLRMSPISLSNVSAALALVAAGEYTGIFHISGAQEITYAELARCMASTIGADPGLVQPVSSAAAGATVLFRPEHPALGMTRTSSILGIAPESVTTVLASFATSI